MLYQSILRLGLALLCVFGARQAVAQRVEDKPPDLQRIDIVEHLDARVPLDLVFVNAHGDSVRLGDYFQPGRPVVLSLVYYECPMLCTLVLNGLTAALQKLSYVPGDEFQLVSVSIDPGETPELAAQKKTRYLRSLGRDEVPETGWAFLTGSEGSIRQLAAAIGFRYFYVKERDEYAHPAAIFVLTPDGRISRYLYGIEYKPQDVKLALLEAAEGKIGNTLEKLLLYCYHYDADANSYVLFAQNVMRLGGALTLILIAIFLIGLWTRERLRKA